MKLIIVKSDKQIPVLYVATAVAYDITSNTITLNRTVSMADGETDTMTKDRCYEYDIETYEAINGLFTTGQERIAAALQMSDNELQPAVINPAEGHEFVETQRH